MIYFFIAVSICAVNVFVMISGFFLINLEKRTLLKPLMLIIKVVFFSELLYVINVFVENERFSLSLLLRHAIPTNYYVVLYIVLYLVSPIINLAMKNMSRRNNKAMLILLFLLFSVEPTLVDIMRVITGSEFSGLSTIGFGGSQAGYTIVNFVLMYIIGAYIKLYSPKISTKKLVAILGMLIVVITIWGKWDSSTAWEYCNPMVIIEAICLFLVFSRIEIKSQLVVRLGKVTFLVFLIHGYFLKYFGIEKAVSKGVLWMFLHMLFTIGSIIVICYVVDNIYEVLMNPIRKVFSKIELLNTNIYDV